MKSFKKVKNLEEYYFINDFVDKELKFKIFKLRLHTCQMKLMNIYLNKYLVIQL